MQPSVYMCVGALGLDLAEDDGPPSSYRWWPMLSGGKGGDGNVTLSFSYADDYDYDLTTPETKRYNNYRPFLQGQGTGLPILSE